MKSINQHPMLVSIIMILVIVMAGDSIQGATAALTNDSREQVLQACPAIEEEIVDLELLADGLRVSKAVGLFDKIRLKSSIDELLARMEAFHDGNRGYSLEELQEQYDVLLMRIAVHLQHKDILLHGQLCNAWGLIWFDLEDPGRFAEKFK